MKIGYVLLRLCICWWTLGIFQHSLNIGLHKIHTVVRTKQKQIKYRFKCRLKYRSIPLDSNVISMSHCSEMCEIPSCKTSKSCLCSISGISYMWTESYSARHQQVFNIMNMLTMMYIQYINTYMVWEPRRRVGPIYCTY